ncbi:uncharacterized protein LOC111280255 isoform X2 [Durio zibethinus]|uniref:Uncharacterized protein LOC111280255 isoform X2 n=1 Tax=Durio zibethinus TaxID=66656 RepID=A0A6P5X4T8_DURZI|nr:uncharacterized protein LOC111280255 isoform X2 [Durio zibethinus]
MNKAWMNLEKAPEGSFKNKLHGLGLRLLVQLVRQRLRQIALSEKLLQLVSNYSQVQNSMVSNGKGNESEHNDSKHRTKDSPGFQWVMEPSEELENLLHRGHDNGSLSEHAFSDICMTFNLNKNDVLKCLMNTILSGMRERKIQSTRLSKEIHALIYHLQCIYHLCLVRSKKEERRKCEGKCTQKKGKNNNLLPSLSFGKNEVKRRKNE